MASGKSRWVMRILAASVFISLFGLGVMAQDDPDPNSPTPVLLGLGDSTRALAVADNGDGARVNISRVSARAFDPDSKVTLFVTHISLMNGEGANAFRVYAEDANGRMHQFPVLDIEPYNAPTARKGVYAVTILTTDQLGYWDPPAADGDVLVQLAWRGLGSNRLRLGLGQMGGAIKDDAPQATNTKSQYSARGGKSASVDSPDYVGYKWSGDRMRFLEQA